MSKRIILAITVAAFCLIGCGIRFASAAKLSVVLTASNVATHEPSIDTLGNYYTVAVDIPEQIKGKELYGAYLEMYLDVGALEYEGQFNNAPSLEVYALKTVFADSEDANQFGSSSFGPRNVVLGVGKRVLIDITSIIKTFLQDPESNHGLIIGSLTGMRDGLFTIKKDVISKDVFGQINYFYDDRIR